MRTYLSCDIEGTNGICDWQETNKSHPDYPAFAARMTKEVAAACEGINQVDPAGEIVIKDAHSTARNLDHDMLPRNTKLIRGWGCSPYSMMFGIDQGFDAAMFTGYHSAGGTNGTPLAHTMVASTIFHIKINGVLASEFLMNYYSALYNKVPVVMVTGDAALCEAVKEVDPAIRTVAAYTGWGESVTSPHPEATREEIRKTAAEALRCRGEMSLKLPREFQTELRFHSHLSASRAAHYPGARLLDPHTVGYDTGDYYEFLRFFMFR